MTMTDGLDISLLPPGGGVLCAVSGGADSVYLLCRLCELRESLGLRVWAAHYNHCLRGAESDRDEAFVRDLCAGSAWRHIPAAAMSRPLPVKTASAPRTRRAG